MAGKQLLTALYDAGEYTELSRLSADADGAAEVVTAVGLVNGTQVYAFAQEQTVRCGAFGRKQAEKIGRLYQLAAQTGSPLVGCFDSDGMKLQEGLDAMDALAEVLCAANRLSGVVPQIAVIAGPCIGSAAMMAANMDLTVAVKGAAWYLKKDEQPTKPACTAATAEQAMALVRRALDLLPANNLTAPAVYEAGAADTVPTGAANAAAAVTDADTLLPLYEGQAALGRIGGRPAGFVTLQGDAIGCCESRRLARFVRLCDAFSLPVITFVDAAGFDGMRAAAVLSDAYAEATCPKITVVTGRAYGSVYIAAAGRQAGADVVLAWPQATICALPPEAAVHVVWSERAAGLSPQEQKKLAEEYAAVEGSAKKAAAGGHVSDVIEPADTGRQLRTCIAMLAGKRVSLLPKKHTTR